MKILIICFACAFVIAYIALVVWLIVSSATELGLGDYRTKPPKNKSK